MQEPGDIPDFEAMARSESEARAQSAKETGELVSQIGEILSSWRNDSEDEPAEATASLNEITERMKAKRPPTPAGLGDYPTSPSEG